MNEGKIFQTSSSTKSITVSPALTQVLATVLDLLRNGKPNMQKLVLYMPHPLAYSRLLAVNNNKYATENPLVLLLSLS